MRDGSTHDVRAGGGGRRVRLASNPMSSGARAYLGPGWDLAKVRGTRFNTGDGLRMALDAGAQPYGQWSGCHAASWAAHAPVAGDVTIEEKFKRDDFMHGIFVNANGKRFVDEGCRPARPHLREIWPRGDGTAGFPSQWQIFDAKTVPLLSEDYRDPSVAPIRANTLDALAAGLTGVNGRTFIETVTEYNRAVRDDVPHDPSRKDGRGTIGLTIPKSNWGDDDRRPAF